MVLREGESSSSAEERGEECSLGQCLTFPAMSEGERSGAGSLHAEEEA